MARKKIFEHKAKQLLFDSLQAPYSGYSVSKENSEKVTLQLDNSKKYVLKVDQGVKGRMKKGLVKLNVAPQELTGAVNDLSQKGYSNFILEEMEDIKEGEERYLSLERVREGVKILYSKIGGVEIESNKDIKEVVIKDENDPEVEKIDLPQDDLRKIVKAFNGYQFAFLEINPLIIRNTKYLILDTAVEVDTAGEFFTRGAWSEDDFAVHNAEDLTEEEKNVHKLAQKSQASFNLTVLNRDGSIFLLLSGGGASIVIADEAAALGKGGEIANYGEYSGNPNEEETYIYTQNLLSLLLKSQSKKKVLVLAGGVANFTDVRATFKGIIRALEDVKDDMAKQGIKVYVRRGGPNQKLGLADMKSYLEKNNLYGHVEGPEMVLTDIVGKAIQSLK